MAFEEIKQGEVKYKETVWVNSSEAKEGDVMAEGYYCKKIITGKFKTAKYIIADKDNSLKGVGSGGHLDMSMAKVTPGDYIRVTYKGKEEIQKGEWKGTNAYTFKVEVDKSRSISEQEACSKLVLESFEDVDEQKTKDTDDIPF